MIRRLVLRNWRVYENLELSLEPGTTFVVAPNGVGKTSLMEGATWALFGDAAPRPTGAVRLGAATATATVDVELPDGRLLTVERELPHRPQRDRPHKVNAQIAGRILAADDLEQIIRVAFAADPIFLARLTMLPRNDNAPVTSNLEKHLCQYFGIEGLQETIAELDKRIKLNERRIRQVKLASSVSADHLAELRAEHAGALDDLETTDRIYQAAATATQATSEALRLARAHLDWQHREQQRLDRLTDLTRSAASLLGTATTSGSIDQALDDLEQSVTGRLDDLRRRRGMAEGRAANIRAALTELNSGIGSCTVCRRPLSPEDTEHARTEHDQELAALSADAAEAARQESLETERLQELRKLIRTLDVLKPAEPPAGEGQPLPRAQAAAQAAEEATAAALTRHVEARSAASAAASRVERANQELRARETLRAEYNYEALANATRHAISSTVATLLSGTIAPLAAEVGARWKRLFAARGAIDITAQGDVYRTINGHVLPFESFSTGEQMGAQLLLRLLMLEAATNATFCWIDEPLEHLDPDSRRIVASILARASTSTAIRQLLVTTYEEPLVRRLAWRYPDDVHLLRIRPNVAS